MELPVDPFEFTYAPADVVFGRGCVDRLVDTLDELGFSQALLVCGTRVGANSDVMDPVRAGLGDRLVGVFDETMPTKKIETAFDGVGRSQTVDADVVVAVGSGSSINVARAICLLDALDLPREEILERARADGHLPTPPEGTPITPTVVVPTTMAGADLTDDGAVSIPAVSSVGSDSGPSPAASAARHTGFFSDPRLMPAAVHYDPDLFATTPAEVLASSAMNGFNKGIETVYSRATTPVSDAHALAGLRYLHAGLPVLRDAQPLDVAYDHAVIGIMLVQYGRRTNVVHTFGNGISDRYDVQQGTVHGIVAPHVLTYVFDRVDGRRRRIADALGLQPADATDPEVAAAIVAAVERLRDRLGLPGRLRTVDGLQREHLPELAGVIADNYKHARNPPGIDPDADDVLGILRRAW